MKEAETSLMEDGFAIGDFFDPEQIRKLEEDLHTSKAFSFGEPDINFPDLLRGSQCVFEIANDLRLLNFLNSVSTHKLFPVNAFILDKTSQSNWQIPWHQDLKIAVKEKREVEGYLNWSIEAGIDHVQPPLSILSQLMTVRIHFDYCNDRNGAVAVIPGSHRRGIIDKSEIPSIVAQGPHKLCEVDKYGVMFMKPLLLHLSPLSQSLSPRRILHLEYGPVLDGGLSWNGF